MSTRPGPELPSRDWDEVIAAVLAGDIAMDDPRVQNLSAEAKLELERLQRLDAAIANQATLERSMQVEVQQLGTPRVPAEVREFLQARAGAMRRPLGWRSKLIWATIAVAATVTFWILLAPKADTPGPVNHGTTLSGEAAVELVEPSDDLQTFRWQSRATGDLRFVVRVFAWDAETARRGAEIVQSGELEENVWHTDLMLPDQIIWRVDVITLGDKLIVGREVRASRKH